MEQNGTQGLSFLMVNRVEVLTDFGCNACGAPFAASPSGERALIATIGGDRIYFFCSGCGDNIMGRVTADSARQHYAWDWAVPLRNGGATLARGVGEAEAPSAVQ